MFLEEIQYPDYRVTFTEEAGGFPGRLELLLRDGGAQVLSQSGAPWLRVRFPDGREAEPFLPRGYAPGRFERDGASCLEFVGLPFRVRGGEPLPHWQLTLSYEFYPDGAAFVRTFFSALTLPAPPVSSFVLEAPASLPPDSGVNWGYWQRPERVDGSIIQALGSVVRNLTEPSDRRFEGAILPLVGFDFGSGDRISRHLEWLMEGQNSLSEDPRDTATEILWQNGSPRVRWEFAREAAPPERRPWQWRNQWGWVISQPPKVRRHPPLRVYHYLDLQQRYPTLRQLEKMAREGADLLILHENWRLDLQNDGWPYDAGELRALVERAHELGLRVAPYIRGNELSVRESEAEWFSRIGLQRDFDGLYADYGGPIHYTDADESYPGGRFCFRQHYRTLRALRKETVGEGGVFFCHTGPFFSASGLGYADGYTAGEGEKGILLRSRRDHAYFSAFAAAPGSLWTAAFPDYSSVKALPFMANTGQTPHVSLGIQMDSSSLSHPREPGCVTFARPLWKLYGLMRGERNVAFVNDLCGDGVFKTDGPLTGAALYRMEDGAALLICSNFADAARPVSVTADWAAAGVSPRGMAGLAMDVTGEAPAANPVAEGSAAVGPLAWDAPAFGVRGWLLYPDGEKWRRRVADYLLPWPAPDEAELQYRRELEQLRRDRFEPAPARTLYLQLTTINQPLPYEGSMWWDLYDMQHELYVTPEGGERTLLGYVSARGFVKEPPTKEDYLWPGVVTPWVPLHGLLPKGRCLVELRVRHNGEDFYSFVRGTLAETPDGPEGRRELRFANELDGDRSRLTFRTELI